MCFEMQHLLTKEIKRVEIMITIMITIDPTVPTMLVIIMQTDATFRISLQFCAWYENHFDIYFFM